MTPPRAEPKQQRSRRTVAAILDAAATVFDRDGIASATMTAVAAEAGVAIASLYAWFPGKDDLLAGLAERHLAEATRPIAAVAERLRREPPDAPGLATAYLDAAIAANSATPRFHRELFERSVRTPGVLARLAAVEDAAAADVELHLRRLGLGGPDVALTARILVQAVEALVHGVVLAAAPGEDRRRAADEVRRLVLAYLLGSGTS